MFGVGASPCSKLGILRFFGLSVGLNVVDWWGMRLSSSLRRGFTIIELIVVIAILAVLLSIAVPSMLGYLSAGDEAKCRENMEQMMRLGTAYSQDMMHTSLLPTSGMDDDEDTAVKETDGWWLALAQQMDSFSEPKKAGGVPKISTIFHCPGDVRSNVSGENAMPGDAKHVSYVSWTDASEDPNNPHSCIRTNAKQRLDELPWLSDGIPVKGKSVVDEASFRKMVMNDSVLDRHGRTIVVGYAGGMVKAYKIEEGEKASAVFKRIAPALIGARRGAPKEEED